MSVCGPSGSSLFVCDLIAGAFFARAERLMLACGAFSTFVAEQKPSTACGHLLYTCSVFLCRYFAGVFPAGIGPPSPDVHRYGAKNAVLAFWDSNSDGIAALSRRPAGFKRPGRS